MMGSNLHLGRKRMILTRFEKFCIGTTHEAFESYRFHVRTQEQHETIDAYVAELRKLARGCNFDNMEDRMIRDRILVGCKSDHVREKLLEDPQLTLKKAMEIARAYEASQVKLNEMKESTVDRIASKEKKKNFDNSNEKYNYLPKGKCTRCGYETHRRRQDCPALKAECNKCKKIGHYAVQCRTREVRHIEDEDMPTLGSVLEINSVNSWNTEILVNQKKMEFRIDTGADVSVIPDRCFKDTKVLKKTDKKLYGPGGAKLEIVGVFTASLEKNNSHTEQDLYVIKGLKKPLLGKPAIEALKVVEMVQELSEDKFLSQKGIPHII